MAKYIIIEDEQLAYSELKRMMNTVRPEWELCGWASSVEQALILIKNITVDLLLVDILLADGDCFDIFEQLNTSTPVIFTTAYDEFALKAFKLNSIDYLLKPIEEAELETALKKYENLRLITPVSDRFQRFRDDYLTSNRKNRFLVQSGDTYRYIETDNIAFFYSEDKYTYLHTFSNSRHIITYTLDQLLDMIDPLKFHRVSRNCIANIRSINKLHKYFAGRLKIDFIPNCPQKVIVSRNRAAGLLDWINGKNL